MRTLTRWTPAPDLVRDRFGRLFDEAFSDMLRPLAQTEDNPTRTWAPPVDIRESEEALVLALMSHGLGDDDVLVTHTQCLLPCNQAPVLSVQPDDVWYGGVDPDAARTIVVEHLVQGSPVETHRLPRTRGTGRR